MPHQISVRDEVWAWAAEQAKSHGEGPASYLSAILIGAMVLTTKPKQPPSQPNSTVKQAIIDVLENRKIYGHACKAILATDWDYTDPASMMQKPPEEVQDFLRCCAYEAGMYADMFATRRNLLKMIFDAYMRAHGGYGG